MSEQLRILVVDDELPVCKNIASTLDSEKYEVDTALSGEEALQKESQKPFDLFIVDLMLPGINGIELLQMIKENRPEVMVIIITGYPSIKTAVQSIKLGAFDYLPKPFTPNDIRNVVARALSRKKILAEETADAKQEIKIPDGLYLIPENAWARVEKDGNVRVGFHHILLKKIGEIRKIEFPKLKTMRYQGEACLRITDAQRHLHRLWSPVTGRIIAINSAVVQDHSQLNHDPYSAGWVLLMTPTRIESDLKNLVPSSK